MELSEAEKKRIARDERTRRNRRGRNNPSAVPAKLTRTSAFAPRRVGLIDRAIERVFHVPGHSVVVVKGGELGTQHRDMIYALFRLKEKITSYKMRNPDAPANGTTFGVPSHIEIVESVVSWRDLLRTMGKTEHVNNLMTAKNAMEDLRQVVMTIYEGDPDEVMRRLENGRLPPGRGQITGVIDSVEWNGVNLDSRVKVRWGRGVMTAIRTRHLVSLNAEVQFALRSDYAKTFWPFIDSNPSHAYVDESILASLAARDLYGPNESNGTRSQFRRDTKSAFEDMVRAGGLKKFRIELLGQGRLKMRRYYYEHALPRAVDRPQLELKLDLDLQLASELSDSQAVA